MNNPVLIPKNVAVVPGSSLPECTDLPEAVVTKMSTGAVSVAPLKKRWPVAEPTEIVPAAWYRVRFSEMPSVVSSYEMVSFGRNDWSVPSEETTSIS